MIRSTLKNTLKKSLQTVEKVKKKEPEKIMIQEEIPFSYEIEEKPIIVNESSFGFDTYEKVQEVPLIIEEQEEIKENKGHEFFYHLQVLAQFHESYILCSNQQGLVIIDEHAAQETYHYEQIKKSLEKPCTQLQPLMVPIQINVTTSIMTMISKINEQVQFFGLHFEPFGNDQVIIREIPIWFQDVHEDEFFQDLMDFFMQNENVDMEKLRKHVLSTMACHSSIRFHRSLTMEEMKQVIVDLQKCEQPYHCPHGRPTVITISDQELLKEFERG